MESGIFSMLFGSGPVVQAVLWLLIVLSVWSWAIVVAKVMQLTKANKESDEFSQLFWEVRNFSRLDESARRLDSSPLSEIFLGGYKEILREVEDMKSNEGRKLDIGSIRRVLSQARFQESLVLEKGLTFLATVASAAPFIGLFGTVWGIMNAFHGLQFAKSTTIQAVAPGISEALVATAVGLAAAIPAAIAYNYFSVLVRNMKVRMERFATDFVEIAQSNF